jgi:hypothetical protein
MAAAASGYAKNGGSTRSMDLENKYIGGVSAEGQKQPDKICAGGYMQNDIREYYQKGNGQEFRRRQQPSNSGVAGGYPQPKYNDSDPDMRDPRTTGLPKETLPIGGARESACVQILNKVAGAWNWLMGLPNEKFSF